MAEKKTPGTPAKPKTQPGSTSKPKAPGSAPKPKAPVSVPRKTPARPQANVAVPRKKVATAATVGRTHLPSTTKSTSPVRKLGRTSEYYATHPEAQKKSSLMTSVSMRNLSRSNTVQI